MFCSWLHVGYDDVDELPGHGHGDQHDEQTGLGGGVSPNVRNVVCWNEELPAAAGVRTYEDHGSLSYTVSEINPSECQTMLKW